MNLNPNQPDFADELIDEALLDEALTEPTPADLEAKILELTDPTMLSLLDEALAPEQPSEELTQRILAATSGQLQPADRPAVLARIGPSPLRYAAAAAILLAVGLGLWQISQPSDTGDSSLAGVNNTAGTTPTDPDESTAEDWFTSEQLAVSNSLFEDTTQTIQGTLQDAADSLDDVTISRDTIWAELDAYEQFLSDIEAGDV